MNQRLLDMVADAKDKNFEGFKDKFDAEMDERMTVKVQNLKPDVFKSESKDEE